MTAAMTDGDRALWMQAQDDYIHALAIAKKAWLTADWADVEPNVVQAATATILIHITKLRSEERIHVRVPPSAAPTAVKRDDPPAPSQASVAVPPCPKCKGPMYDNRGKKKNPKGPDFRCKDKECKDEKGYGTGLWEKDLKKGANSKPVPAGSFDDMPPALGDAAEPDDLPW